MTALLGPAVSDEGEGGLVFAWNILSRSISTLEAATSDLRNATLQKVLRDARGSDFEEDASKHPVRPVLRDIQHVVRFMATFLLELTTVNAGDTREHKANDSSNVLGASLRSAYRQVFAQLHPWIVQKMVEDAITASSLSQSAFFTALRRGNERVVRNERILRKLLRTCGSQLQVWSCVCGVASSHVFIEFVR